MKIVVTQPSLLPWPGFWNKVFNADLVVLWGGVQFDKRDYQHRVKLDGQWLTLPVEAHSSRKLIHDVKLASFVDWAALGRIVTNSLEGTPYRSRLAEVEEAFTYRDKTGANIRHPTSLHETLVMFIKQLYRAINCKTEIVYDHNIPAGDTALERLDNTIARWTKHPKDDPEIVYLTGSELPEYAKDKRLTVPARTLIQRVKPGTATDSILKVIATSEDPKSYIMDCATWELFE